MNIRARRSIHETAQAVLQRSGNAKKIVFFYAAVCCGLSLAGTLVSAFLGRQIAGTGGLGNIGLRSVLSTGQSVLPVISLIVTTCLGLGYHTAMLCFVRGFDADHRTLTDGFRYFGAIFRTMLLQGIVYFISGMGAMYLSSFIFMMTPLAQPFMEVMEPVLSSVTVMDDVLALDEATMMAAMEAMIPMMWILLAVCLAVMVPLYYRFRMVTFALADDPAKGAVHALLKSRALMHRNRFALFRLDLTLWWYYLVQLLISLVCYGDVLLSMAGIPMPLGANGSYYLFYGISLAMQLALYCFGMNRFFAVYAVAYDTLQEQVAQSNLPTQM